MEEQWLLLPSPHGNSTKSTLKINYSCKCICIPLKEITLTFKFEATCHVFQIVKKQDRRKNKKRKLKCLMLLNKEHGNDAYSYPWKECR